MSVETELSDALMIIASGIGIAADDIFDILVSGQGVVGIVNLCVIMATIVFACIAGRIAWNMWKRYSDGEEEDAENIATCYVIIAIVVLLCGVVVYPVFQYMGYNVIRLVCPEYTAMKDIIDAVVLK